MWVFLIGIALLKWREKAVQRIYGMWVFLKIGIELLKWLLSTNHGETPVCAPQPGDVKLPDMNHMCAESGQGTVHSCVWGCEPQ